jgi:hypothetical protein
MTGNALSTFHEENKMLILLRGHRKTTMAVTLSELPRSMAVSTYEPDTTSENKNLQKR